MRRRCTALPAGKTDMTHPQNMSRTQPLKSSRAKGLRAAHVKAAVQREQVAEEEPEVITRKYGGGRASRRPGRMDEVPPGCHRKPGMTVEEGTVAAVAAMEITHPLDVLLTFFALCAETSAEQPATNGLPTEKIRRGRNLTHKQTHILMKGTKKWS